MCSGRPQLDARYASLSHVVPPEQWACAAPRVTWCRPQCFIELCVALCRFRLLRKRVLREGFSSMTRRREFQEVRGCSVFDEGAVLKTVRSWYCQSAISCAFVSVPTVKPKLLACSMSRAYEDNGDVMRCPEDCRDAMIAFVLAIHCLRSFGVEWLLCCLDIWMVSTGVRRRTGVRLVSSRPNCCARDQNRDT